MGAAQALEGGANLLFGIIFLPKLQENEKNWTGEGTSPSHPLRSATAGNRNGP